MNRNIILDVHKKNKICNIRQPSLKENYPEFYWREYFGLIKNIYCKPQNGLGTLNLCFITPQMQPSNACSVKFLMKSH